MLIATFLSVDDKKDLSINSFLFYGGDRLARIVLIGPIV
jgi:hypothetical protein